MKDLTILYYTANVVEEPFGKNIRNHLLSLFPNGQSIISISHKPITLGQNIVVKNFEVLAYNIYRQILIGALAATTEYVACAEDDCVYNLDHFKLRPSNKDTFLYNGNRWHVDKNTYFYRNRIGMFTCIANRELMINTLETRFKKYNTPLVMRHFGEPGRYELQIGLPFVKMEIVKTEQAILTFNHRTSIGGKRKHLPNDKFEKELPIWGNSEDLWNKFYNNSVDGVI